MSRSIAVDSFINSEESCEASRRNSLLSFTAFFAIDWITEFTGLNLK